MLESAVFCGENEHTAALSRDHHNTKDARMLSFRPSVTLGIISLGAAITIYVIHDNQREEKEVRPLSSAPQAGSACLWAKHGLTARFMLTISCR